MTLLVTLEQGPRAQKVQQTRLDQGEIVIGRSASADWQIDDPEMFISRAHCTLSGDERGYFVTDTSSSGLFVDERPEPLGAGNTIELRDGMHLRLGDYVMLVEIRQPGAPPHEKPSHRTQNGGLGADDFFSMPSEEKPKPQRPSELPNPFDQPQRSGFTAVEPERPSSPAFDDPFSLDPLPTPRQEAKPRPEPAVQAAAGRDDFADWSRPEPALQRPPAPQASRAKPAPAASHDALRAAFLRGMGLDLSEVPGGDSIAEMEKFGREYRLMMEGLMQLLRKRAEEKGNARVAQTIVGAADVNPLKFLPTVDDALGVILLDRSPGFLAGEPAIADAIRDLAQHHVRAWRGVQEALRRMIDQFDPAAIEDELQQTSTVETLLAGGRGAKLWELYKKRHREISANAESSFLGDLGADFRRAYEEE